ncbi:hypothetical protein KCP74_02330 [Salmonella enterica subsp. enterica]|nr:hypothetical protein KCP74_02330 [Salmonella enterica subsp. enterica]
MKNSDDKHSETRYRRSDVARRGERPIRPRFLQCSQKGESCHEIIKPQTVSQLAEHLTIRV